MIHSQALCFVSSRALPANQSSVPEFKSSTKILMDSNREVYETGNHDPPQRRSSLHPSSRGPHHCRLGGSIPALKLLRLGP
jgi:hypothetical protein